MKAQLFKDDKIQLNIKLQNILNNIIIPLTNTTYQPYQASSYESRVSKSIYTDYHELIKENIKESNNITFILHSISKEIFFAELIQDKIKLLNLLPEFFSPFLNNQNLNISISYPYLSRIV